MCGIIGAIGEVKDIPISLSALKHRGPDDSGLWYSGDRKVVLGHTRLSILDVTSAGHQPMHWPKEDSGGSCSLYTVVYNGEIYNFLEVKRHLEALGNKFYTNCDTEVLLAAYAQWGLDCCKMFRGMFAFAIWDKKECELVLVRDRLGIKPLYYTLQNNALVFASELKALLQTAIVSPRLDKSVLLDYIVFGAVMQPQTIVEDVQMLDAGCALRVSLSKSSGKYPVLSPVIRYWDLHSSTQSMRKEVSQVSYSDACLKVRMLLEDAINMHLVSDVPVGVFLSGGIDSTVVTGLASQISGSPLRTFAVGFDHQSGGENELDFARMAASRFGCEHNEIIVSGRDIADSWTSIISSLDQPSVDGVNTWLVSRAARKSVTVALSGIGSDEIFGGYPHFRSIEAWDWVKLPESLRKKLGRLSEGLPSRFSRNVRWLAGSRQSRLEIARTITPAHAALGLLNSDLMSPRIVKHLTDPGIADPIQGISYLETIGYLKNTLLRDSDAMSMAASLELRPVLLDHKLIEFVYSLKGSFKTDGSISKKVLKDSCADLLPPKILNRKKAGFTLPFVGWLKTDIRDIAITHFESQVAKRLLCDKARRRIVRQLYDRNVREPIWHLLILVATAESLNLR